MEMKLRVMKSKDDPSVFIGLRVVLSLHVSFITLETSRFHFKIA